MASTSCSPVLVSMVTCPECNKVLQLRSFSYRHSCKQPRKQKSSEQLADMAAKLQTRAVERFYKRKGQLPPISPDGGVALDGCTSPDGGVALNGSIAPDGCTSLDGGVALDGCTSLDGAVSLDGGVACVVAAC